MGGSECFLRYAFCMEWVGAECVLPWWASVVLRGVSVMGGVVVGGGVWVRMC